MKIEWTEFALNNLNKFQRNSKKTKENLKKYYQELIKTINELSNNPRLGKIFYNISEFELRQLIYKEHRVLYLINNNTIVLLAIVHITYPVNNTLYEIKKYIKEYINEIKKKNNL